MNNFWKNFKNALGIIAAIVVIILVAIPFVFVYFYLRKQDKIITIYPKVSVKEVKNKDDIDTKALGDAIKAAESIMKRFKG